MDLKVKDIKKTFSEDWKNILFKIIKIQDLHKRKSQLIGKKIKITNIKEDKIYAQEIFTSKKITLFLDDVVSPIFIKEDDPICEKTIYFPEKYLSPKLKNAIEDLGYMIEDITDLDMLDINIKKNSLIEKHILDELADIIEENENIEVFHIEFY